MSFILDALRKSETARRRSEAPDLFTTMPGTVAPASARMQWPMFMIGGVGVLSLIVALWLFSQRAPPATTVNTAAGPVVIANTPALEITGAAYPAAVSAMPMPVEPPIPPQSKPRISPPAPTPAQTAPPSASSIANPRDLPAPPQTRTPPPIAPSAATTLPTGDSIVSLGDLDPGMRNQLPPLKLSMHLWNETPSQRFVILDGQRLKEGDVLGEIVIERITRDGAMLAWRGGRLKIELR